LQQRRRIYSLIRGIDANLPAIAAKRRRNCDRTDRIEIGASTMYRTVTRNIEVVVKPRFVADKSSPENNYFFWAYTISITNKSAETVQLKTRHWRITDANGRRQEVRGAGVVGEEPVLKAGEQFEYTSGVPLQTPSGFMVGSYGMVSSAGEHFDIEVPAFSLDSVETKRTLN
jgi:ApaG protein